MFKLRQQIIERKQQFSRLIFSTVFKINLVILLVVFSLLYVWQINSISTKGYDIASMKKKIEFLEQENRDLEVKIAQSSSLNSIQKRLVKLNLVNINDNEFVFLNQPDFIVKR